MSGTNARASQVGLEFLGFAAPAARASQVGVEFLTTVQSFGTAYASQVGVEFLGFAAPAARVSQVGLEILYLITPPIPPIRLPWLADAGMYAPRWYLLSRPIYLIGGCPILCVAADPDQFRVAPDPDALQVSC